MDGVVLLSTVIGTVELGVKLVTKARESFKSGTGVSQDLLAWRGSVDRLRLGIELLRAQSHNNSKLCSQLTDFTTQTESLAEELVHILDQLAVDERNRAWRSVAVAVKSMRYKSRCRSIESRLRDLHIQLLVYCNVHMSEQCHQSLVMAQHVQVEVNNIVEQLPKRFSEIKTLVQVNRQVPTELRYLPETGEHILIDDGLDQNKSRLPLELCSSAQALIHVMMAKFGGRNLPGSAHVEVGSVCFMDYSENTQLSDDNWSQYIVSGAVIKMAFISGTWHGLPTSKCARCSTAFCIEATRRGWRECHACGLRLKYMPPDAFPYEPPDIVLTPEVWQDFQRTKMGGVVSQEETQDPEDAKGQTSEPDATIAPSVRKEYDTLIDLWCHRLLVKWEPIFKITYRYLDCRCPLHLSTPSQFEWSPEMTILIGDSCPRHNDIGLRRKDYGDFVDIHTDPYFDRFGGYNAFRAVLGGDQTALTQLGGDAFLASHDLPMAMEALGKALAHQKDVVDKAWLEYDCEIYDRLQKMGHELPEDEAKVLAEYKRTREKADEQGPFKNAVDFSPWTSEVRSILSGKWDGIPHWE